MTQDGARILEELNRLTQLRQENRRADAVANKREKESRRDSLPPWISLCPDSAICAISWSLWFLLSLLSIPACVQLSGRQWTLCRAGSRLFRVPHGTHHDISGAVSGNPDKNDV